MKCGSQMVYNRAFILVHPGASTNVAFRFLANLHKRRSRNLHRPS